MDQFRPHVARNSITAAQGRRMIGGAYALNDDEYRHASGVVTLAADTPDVRLLGHVVETLARSGQTFGAGGQQRRGDDLYVLYCLMRDHAIPEGRGYATVSDLERVLCDDLGYCSGRTLKRYLRAGDGVFWHRSVSASTGAAVVALRAISRVLVDLGIDVRFLRRHVRLKAAHLTKETATGRRSVATTRAVVMAAVMRSKQSSAQHRTTMTLCALGRTVGRSRATAHRYLQRLDPHFKPDTRKNTSYVTCTDLREAQKVVKTIELVEGVPAYVSKIDGSYRACVQRANSYRFTLPVAGRRTCYRLRRTVRTLSTWMGRTGSHVLETQRKRYYNDRDAAQRAVNGSQPVFYVEPLTLGSRHGFLHDMMLQAQVTQARGSRLLAL